jgi:hypothetical protein
MLLEVLALLTGVLQVMPAAGQLRWTAETRAIWKTETTIGRMLDSGDLTGALGHFFGAFRAWGPNTPVRQSRAEWVNRIQYGIRQGKSLVGYALVPLDIWIRGDYGYVQYKASVTLKDPRGKTAVDRERCIDLVLKKGGRWLVVGSLTMAEDRGL